MKMFEAHESPYSGATAETSEAANAAVPPEGEGVCPDCSGKDQTTGNGHYKFVLYIAGNSPNSERAVANLQRLCADYIPERHQLEIVDTLRDPQRALADGVLLTPMLVKFSPEPVKRLIGSLSLSQPILRALGLLASNRVST